MAGDNQKGILWPNQREVLILKKAARDLRFLLERGYKRKTAIAFVGNHYQLSKALRHMLFRAVISRDVARKRRSKRVWLREIEGEDVLVDGYNCFITLESAIRGLPVIRCDDGFIRDVSGVFRRFRPGSRTLSAWQMMEGVLRRHRPGYIRVFLDAPYSKSGAFCMQMNSWLKEAGLKGECVLSRKSERLIARSSSIKITADSVIIDHSQRVFDLTGHIITKLLRLRPLTF